MDGTRKAIYKRLMARLMEIPLVAGERPLVALDDVEQALRNELLTRPPRSQSPRPPQPAQARPNKPHSGSRSDPVDVIGGIGYILRMRDHKSWAKVAWEASPMGAPPLTPDAMRKRVERYAYDNGKPPPRKYERRTPRTTSGSTQRHDAVDTMADSER